MGAGDGVAGGAAPSPHVEQTIGSFGSVALLLNAITAPAMLNLPYIVRAAGLVPTVFLLVLCSVFSSYTATLFADCIALIPGNRQFRRAIEFSDSFRIYLGTNWFYTTQIAFFGCLMSQNIAAIVATAQSVDSFMSSVVFGHAVALRIYPRWEMVQWEPDGCDELQRLKACIPFRGEEGYLISAGYVLCTMLLLPLGLRRLKENMAIQMCSAILFCILVLEFVTAFCAKGLDWHRVSWWGSDWTNLVGIVLYNYAFVVAVPTWLSEKKPEVNPNHAVWISSTVSTSMYIVFAVFGALAFPRVSENILSLLASEETGIVTRTSACIFGILMIGLDIPIFCVLAHSNLSSGKICSHNWALFWGSIFPWLISFFFYQGDAALSLLAWAGVFLVGLVAFIAPLILCLTATAQIREKVMSYASIPQITLSVTSPTIGAVTASRAGAGVDNDHATEDDNDPDKDDVSECASRRNRGTRAGAKPVSLDRGSQSFEELTSLVHAGGSARHGLSPTSMYGSSRGLRATRSEVKLSIRGSGTEYGSLGKTETPPPLSTDADRLAAPTAGPSEKQQQQRQQYLQQQQHQQQLQRQRGGRPRRRRDGDEGEDRYAEEHKQNDRWPRSSDVHRSRSPPTNGAAGRDGNNAEIGVDITLSGVLVQQDSTFQFISDVDARDRSMQNRLHRSFDNLRTGPMPYQQSTPSTVMPQFGEDGLQPGEGDFDDASAGIDSASTTAGDVMSLNSVPSAMNTQLDEEEGQLPPSKITRTIEEISTVIKPLPRFLERYRRELTGFVLGTFSILIVCSIFSRVVSSS